LKFLVPRGWQNATKLQPVVNMETLLQELINRDAVKGLSKARPAGTGTASEKRWASVME